MIRVQFRPGLSMPGAFQQSGTEVQCETALQRTRWPQGFRWANTILGNVKTRLRSAYRAFHFGEYAEPYLGVIAYRFNRRIQLHALPQCLLVARRPLVRARRTGFGWLNLSANRAVSCTPLAACEGTEGSASPCTAGNVA